MSISFKSFLTSGAFICWKSKLFKSEPNLFLIFQCYTTQCTPCYTSRSIYCQQVLKTTTFTSNQTRETFTIFHQVTCHSNYVIYLLEWILCKIQHVGKSETSFNIRLNNHRKDIKKPNTIEACKHFNNNEHTFSTHEKFIIIEQVRNINTIPTETLKLRLREKDNFWIKKLKTLTPNDLNQELN